MRTDEYYHYVAKVSINASITALFPAVIIVIANLTVFHRQQIMLLTIPFFIYSLFCFQVFLGKKKQAFAIGKNIEEKTKQYRSIFSASHLVVFFMNTFSPKLMIFFPNGNLAAVVKKYNGDEKKKGYSKIFAIHDSCERLIGKYMVRKEKPLKIDVYDQKNNYVGSLEKTQLLQMKKGKVEFLNAEGRFVAAVEGASIYMDEQIVDPYQHTIAQLRRGWMPLEWSSHFPNPNTPVLSFSKEFSDKDKVLQMSLLIYEFFIER